MAGYSGTPLPRKLGLKDGQRAGFAGLPGDLAWLADAAAFAACEQAADWRGLGQGPFDYLHLFSDRRAQLAQALPVLRGKLEPAGMIWASWPKKASRVATDLTEDAIREEALKGDLVDVKVCAVDATWSGLKLVIRKEARP